MKIHIPILALLFSVGAYGQIEHPKASPAAKIVQEIGLSTITLSYSRPGVKGRKIMGDVVPYGRIWRVGANESTKFTTDTDLIVKGHALSKGTYALYAFPEATTWEIVFHKNTSHWGDGRKAYDPKEDAFRIVVIPDTIPNLQENFLISFDVLDHNSAQMIFSWEYTQLKIPIHVDTHALMQKEIEKQIKENPSAQTYYEAARYYQEQNEFHEQALEYLNKAIALGGDTYYFHRIKSLVQADLGDYEAAIRSAIKSLKIAESLEKDEFVRMNQKNIEAWSGLLKLKNN